MVVEGDFAGAWYKFVVLIMMDVTYVTKKQPLRKYINFVATLSSNYTELTNLFMI